MAGKLTDRKVLIFDVYGTLMDWESGIYNALQPLLSKFEASNTWSQKEALQAFGSVETDLQSQYPEMVYSDLLAKVHEVLEQRLKALSSQDIQASTLDAKTSASEGTSEGASTSAAAVDPTIDPHVIFGNSIKHWPIFQDSAEALKRLSRHFKLVVLSNVDRQSFQHTHAVLSEGTYPSDVTPYLYPSNNPHKFWHPQATAGSKSPFTAIATAQDTGCYKPALGGFRAVLDYIQTQTDLFDGTLEGSTDVKSKVLVVAQSLPHDHVPARELGVPSVWIDRQSAVTCNELPGDQKPWTWRFETLGQMADAVEKELLSK
ncbi:haloacid dehalogenase [Coprinopsis marcescibilis]|uniref:Haloacid dehalogenase n=1 Tax=Coprinopsis marcescibilis TaxID=230819 RepID=A0A5C3KLC7_COPMA|nr:haloacid dehalogenase [Coprinopsis marcescibilis]